MARHLTIMTGMQIWAIKPPSQSGHPCGLWWDPLEAEALPAEVCLGRAAVAAVDDLAGPGEVKYEVVAHFKLGGETLHDGVILVRGEDAAGGEDVLLAHGEVRVGLHGVEGLRILKNKNDHVFLKLIRLLRFPGLTCGSLAPISRHSSWTGSPLFRTTHPDAQTPLLWVWVRNAKGLMSSWMDLIRQAVSQLTVL